MDIWKALAGIVLVVVGAVAAAQGYITVSQCNSTFGQVANFFSSLLGGSAVQGCYNAQLVEIGGILVALIGLVVIFVGNKKGAAKKRK
jgi:predicted MFS family arabinose efflux permease